jgi:hypothetical protein
MGFPEKNVIHIYIYHHLFCIIYAAINLHLFLFIYLFTIEICVKMRTPYRVQLLLQLVVVGIRW